MEGRDYPARMLLENRSNYAPAREKLVVDDERALKRSPTKRKWFLSKLGICGIGREVADLYNGVEVQVNYPKRVLNGVISYEVWSGLTASDRSSKENKREPIDTVREELEVGSIKNNLGRQRLMVLVLVQNGRTERMWETKLKYKGDGWRSKRRRDDAAVKT